MNILMLIIGVLRYVITDLLEDFVKFNAVYELFALKLRHHILIETIMSLKNSFLSHYQMLRAK